MVVVRGTCAPAQDSRLISLEERIRRLESTVPSDLLARLVALEQQVNSYNPTAADSIYPGLGGPLGSSVNTLMQYCFFYINKVITTIGPQLGVKLEGYGAVPILPVADLSNYRWSGSATILGSVNDGMQGTQYYITFKSNYGSSKTMWVLLYLYATNDRTGVRTQLSGSRIVRRRYYVLRPPTYALTSTVAAGGATTLGTAFVSVCDLNTYMSSFSHPTTTTGTTGPYPSNTNFWSSYSPYPNFLLHIETPNKAADVYFANSSSTNQQRTVVGFDFVFNLSGLGDVGDTFTISVG